MKYLSVCSGIEAATVAWQGLGWKAAAYSEIEPFPSAVLAHHYSDIPNVGDMIRFKEWNIEPETIDLLVGGTPCQSFSVAGLRKGLADPRGNLALVYCGILDHLKPRWFIWENVPGVLSSNAGRDFGSFLGAVAELGYGFAYRVLDAQYFGVAQRRRRVFVVGYLGDWRRAAAVLFERHSLSGHPAPSRKTGQGFTAATAPSLTASGQGVERTGESRGQDPVIATFDRQSSGEYGTAPIASTVSAMDYKGVYDIITHCLRGEGFDASEDGTGRGTPLVPTYGEYGANGGPMLAVAFHHNAQACQLPTADRDTTISDSLTCSQQAAVAFAQNSRDEVREMPYAGALAANPGMKQTSYIRQAMQVRRLTPVECERLQGFPDNYTNIPWRKKPESPDGLRYKALGNSMAVPVMAWIGKRIQNLGYYT